MDGNSFPLSLPSFPELATAGSYCAQCIYTANDVRKVVEYARQRGIRVQPEAGKLLLHNSLNVKLVFGRARVKCAPASPKTAQVMFHLRTLNHYICSLAWASSMRHCRNCALLGWLRACC